MQRQGLNYELVTSQFAGHDHDLAAQAAQAGYRHFIVIGGDGTVNRVINGIVPDALQHNSLDQFCLAVIPTGNGNDWARSLGIHNVAQALEALKTAHCSDQSVASVTAPGQLTRYFVNGLSVGFSAEIIRAKQQGSSFSYLSVALRTLTRFRPFVLQLDIDGEQRSDSLFLCYIALGHYCGGGMRLAPHAAQRAERFALTLVRPLSLWSLLANLPKLFNGRVAEHPATELLYARQLSLSSAATEQISVEMDGEYLGELPLQLRLCSQRLRVISRN